MAWGTLKLIGLRLQAQNFFYCPTSSDQCFDLNEERKWGFGQILSVSLTTLPLWAIYAKIYGITCLLSNHASLIVMKESNRKMSKKAHPVSRRPSRLPCQSFDHFGCFETAWFPKLIMLCFGMALVIAADLLVRFGSTHSSKIYSRTSNLTVTTATRGYAAVYCILVGLCALILMVFVSICLAIQSRSFIQPLKPVRRKATFGRINSKKESIVQRVLWTLLIFSLLGGLLIFDWVLFPASGGTLLGYFVQDSPYLFLFPEY